MKVIKLPSVLPGNLDIKAINQQLRDRTVQLDWSAVTAAPEATLAILLEGLDISDDADILGIDGTLADSLIDQLLAFSQHQPQPITSNKRSKKTLKSGSQPETWIPPAPKLASQTPVDEVASHNVVNDAVPQAKARVEKYTVFQQATPAEIRHHLEESIIKELHGPAQGQDEEVNEAHVTDRYLVGVLAPIKRNHNIESESEPAIEDQPELQDSIALTDKDNAEEGNAETNVPTTDSMFPSSMGMTFCVSSQAQALEIRAEWGCYIRQASEISFTDKGNPKQIWKRYPLKGSIILDLKTNQEIDEVPVPDQAPSVCLRGHLRQLPDGDWIVSVFLVNGQHEPAQN